MISDVPTVFVEGPYAFRFFSSDDAEPVHIHVIRDNCSAKFWLNPVSLVSNYGFAPVEIFVIKRIIRDRIVEIEQRWSERFKR